MAIPLWDGYWTRILWGSYEPEVAIMLRIVLDPETAFVDCGANIGYWSIWALGQASHVVAVEASPITFARLLSNCCLNAAQFDCVNAAVWSTDETAVEFNSHRRLHSSSTLSQIDNLPPQHRSKRDLVSTISIPTLLRRVEACRRAVVKLDIEGAELVALERCWDQIAEGALCVLYEDHGADLTSVTTTKVLEHGLSVWTVIDRHTVPIHDANCLRTIKSDETRGYNFIAASRTSPFGSSLRRAEG